MRQSQTRHRSDTTTTETDDNTKARDPEVTELLEKGADLLDEIEEILDSPDQAEIDRLAYKEKLRSWAANQSNFRSPVIDEYIIEIPCPCP